MDDLGLAWLVRSVRARLRIAWARLLRDLAIWHDIRAFPPLAVLAGLNCVASLILIRQYAGGLRLQMMNWRLCMAALATAGLTIASRWFLARIERDPPAFRIRALLAALSVFPIIALLTAATPRNSLGAVGLVGLLAIAAGNVNLLWHRRRSPAGSNATSRSTEPAPPRVYGDAAPAMSSANEAAMSSASQSADSEWIERSRGEEGQMLWRGKIYARFAAGQSLATVHIPFTPAFSRIPEFACEIINQPAVRARSPAVYRYGVRVELKRSGNVSMPLDVEVRFRARPGLASRAA